MPGSRAARRWDRARFEREISALVQRKPVSRRRQLEAGPVVGELARIAAGCGLRRRQS